MICFEYPGVVLAVSSVNNKLFCHYTFLNLSTKLIYNEDKKKAQTIT